MSGEKPRRLGRGLEALIGAAQSPTAPASDMQRIPIARIRPNPFQPRHDFDPTQLAELEASIKANGLLQPITVRRRGEQFELVAGERRLRAVSNLQWKDVPAVIRDFDDQTLLVLALVENLQRSDLNAVEEARGYQRLLNEFSLTHQQIAEAVGKDRTTITNLLRVLTLPESIQRAVEQGKLSAGHARALVGVGSEESTTQIANEVMSRGLSVRQTEQRVRALRAPANGESTTARERKSGSQALDPAARRVEEELRRYLQTDVQLRVTGQARGTITVSFYSADDLERLMELMVRTARTEF
jgi:ParB family transcriptional regulator, chromosome partitioning protein